MIIYESDIRRAMKDAVAQKKNYRPEQTRAAVLIPVVTQSAEPELLLTQRTDLVEHHKSQIAFPGGVVDPEDKTIIDTALRETEEELGIPSGMIEVIGTIDEVSSPSRFLITPVVGIMTAIPLLRLNQNEVESAFTVPLSFFTDEANMRIEYREVEGKKREVYFYKFGDKIIWGVTAYIIRIFLSCISKKPNDSI
jgi:8-oxo-dGTP pyrophosphatase MutT (NUDIX family)